MTAAYEGLVDRLDEMAATAKANERFEALGAELDRLWDPARFRWNVTRRTEGEWVVSIAEREHCLYADGTVEDLAAPTPEMAMEAAIAWTREHASWT